MMDICRTCLKIPAKKHILELEKDLKEGQNCFRIMLFCLDIEVIEDSKITTNLCKSCYKKIISFYKFKTLSLKNDVYLKSMAQTQLEDEKLSVYVDENGIKHENLLDSDEFGPSVVEECNTEFKIEIDLKEDELLGDVEINVKNEDTHEHVESDEEPLSVVQKVKYENTKDDSRGNAHIRRKRGRPRKENVRGKRRVCEECGKSVRHLKAHLVQHQRKYERSVFQCKLCPKFFVTKSGHFKHHQSIHLGIPLHRESKCDICNKEVKFLKAHIISKHKPEILPYGCVSCERRYSCLSALNKHMTKHVGVPDLPYECDICHKRFRCKDVVSRHIRKIHLHEKNYQCEICSKTYFDKQPFIYHMAAHSDERRHKCDKCGSAFKTQDVLRRHHVSVHSDVRRFQCTVCSKSFKVSSTLVYHMRTHSKERPYPCRYCDMRFGRTHHWKRHESTMHKDRGKVDSTE